MELAWGILGTGRIAGVFARGLARSRTGRLVAVGSRSQDSADAFGAEHDVARRHGSYEGLLADEGVDAIYVSAVNPLHAEWTIRAMEAGKHVLCEKPLALDHAEALTMVEAAERHDRFLMEAFMYRCHPQVERIVELIRSGALGEVKAIQSAFSFGSNGTLVPRLARPELGGGGIFDVGCYSVSAARLIAGAATGQPFAEPVEVRAIGHLTETGVDDYTAAVMRFPGDIVAQVFCGVVMGGENAVSVLGTEGRLTVPVPWVARSATTLLLQRAGGSEPEKIHVPFDEDLYGCEADVVAAHLEERQAPQMSWNDSLGNMRAIDLWREAIGAS